MSLPLTLAVLDGMVVSGRRPDAGRAADGDRRNAEAEEGRRCTRFGADGRVIVDPRRLRAADRCRHAARLSRDAATSRTTASRCWSKPKAAARSALLVDAIQDQRQVVIKSLEANYGTRRRASPPRPSSATAAWRSSSTSTPSVAGSLEASARRRTVAMATGG